MALVSKSDPGNGILVDVNSVGRPIGDTSSGAVYVSDLPKNFQGGEEALHFALGEIFAHYGKIKKIELYMEKGILETQNFKGEALVVYHPCKLTGTHDEGDPVYDACKDLDGKYRVLGYRNWRFKVEPAAWQKEGFNVKERAKKFPCVEIANLWDYNGSQPLSWFAEVQDAIRNHANEHIKDAFVKVDPSEGTAVIWCKGAQDAMKFASIMQKSYFMGRKVTASLCRKERPISTDMPKIAGASAARSAAKAAESALGQLAPGKLSPELAAQIRKQAEEQAAAAEEAAKAAAARAEEPSGPVAGPSFMLREGCKIVLKGLVSKPENNGRRAIIVSFVDDVQKYQVRLDDGRFVKVKPENVEPVPDAQPKKVPQALQEEADDEEDEEEDSTANAQVMAGVMARGDAPHGPEKMNADQLEATVCVDPSLLPKREGDEEEDEASKRERSRSRERRRQEQIEAMKARVEANKKEGKRCGWVVSGPPPPAGQDGTSASAALKEPDESREELMKMSVSKLKELLMKFGKTARGCLEKKDFVDRLKPNA
eukprot:TRINITY_DN109367_c0_g1_i1.p1 TRINITY_DN109367_c0_g1~~TRINITY_DN109367_c0_g1_i1.p1  ORF type:complete len:553 (-),score=123.93 TRINITY_DN109367_c0_g1_i1:47-1669(-)